MIDIIMHTGRANWATMKVGLRMSLFKLIIILY